jgi:hypothetical protein
MILIELAPGVRREFGTVDELALAISRGELPSNSRIYHGKAEQWLPITVHPAFQKQARRHWDEPLPPLPRTRWTFFDASAELSATSRPADGRPSPTHNGGSTDPEKSKGDYTSTGVVGKALRFLRSRRRDPSS